MKPAPLKGRTWNPYTIPDVIDPGGVRCVKVYIPDSLQWLQIFAAVMDTMCHWKNYELLGDTSAAQCAALMRSIMQQYNSFESCSDGIVYHGIEQELDMGLRIDCDCNVWITCCDGTEMQLASKAMVDSIGQLGSGATQPAVGGCATYHGNVNGNGLWVLPTLVNTGDVITLTNMAGATYNPANSAWYCPDGKQFFGGVCTPYPITAGGNPMPAVSSGKLIAKIGSTYYDIQGAGFTVPAGVASAVLTLQFNYASIATSSGNVNFDITACNNGGGTTYNHLLNFLAASNGFSLEVDSGNTPTTNGVYTLGSGWVDTNSNYVPGNTTSGSARIERIFGTAINISDAVLTYTVTKGTFAPGLSNGLFLYNGATLVASITAVADTRPNGVNTLIIPHGNYTVTRIKGLIYDSFRSPIGAGSAGSGAIQSINVSGNGADPF